MAVITVAEVCELSVRLSVPLLLLALTLAFLQDGKKNTITRLLRPLMLAGIVYFSAINIYPHGMINTLPSYLLGFLTVWILVISVAFILCSPPSRNFHKINVCIPENGGQTLYQVQKHPFAGTPWQRFSWTLDFLATLRGIGWNYSTYNIFRKDNGDLYDPKFLISGKEPYEMRAKERRSAFLRAHLWIAALDYILVDVCTHLMSHDSFLSGAESRNPFFLPLSDCLKWIVMLPCRLVLAGVGVYSVIDLASKAVALLAVGVCGEEWLGSWGQYWNYPPVFGSFHSIWNRGLAGFWGDFWHQMFRFGLTTVAKTVVPITSSSPGSSSSISVRQLLRLLIVFTLSGSLHAAGSCTLASSMPTPLLVRTYPHLTLFTFILQVPGIVIQRLLFRRLAPPPGRRERAFKMKMLLFTCLWSMATMPFLVADFAAGQLFKIQFLPFSVVSLALRGCEIAWNGKAPLARAVVP